MKESPADIAFRDAFHPLGHLVPDFDAVESFNVPGRPRESWIGFGKMTLFGRMGDHAESARISDLAYIFNGFAPFRFLVDPKREVMVPVSGVV